MNRLEFSSLINCFVWFSLSFSSFLNEYLISFLKHMVGSLKMNTALEYSTRVVQEVDHRCKKSTLNDLAYLTHLRIPLTNEPSNTIIVFYAPNKNLCATVWILLLSADSQTRPFFNCCDSYDIFLFMKTH
jgi:hypothetical protein